MSLTLFNNTAKKMALRKRYVSTHLNEMKFSVTNCSESFPVRGLQQQRNYPQDSLAVFEEWADKRLTQGGKKIKIKKSEKQGPDCEDLKYVWKVKDFEKELSLFKDNSGSFMDKLIPVQCFKLILCQS